MHLMMFLSLTLSHKNGKDTFGYSVQQRRVVEKKFSRISFYL
jgi:hypothetical protein